MEERGPLYLRAFRLLFPSMTKFGAYFP